MSMDVKDVRTRTGRTIESLCSPRGHYVWLASKLPSMKVVLSTKPNVKRPRCGSWQKTIHFASGDIY